MTYPISSKPRYIIHRADALRIGLTDKALACYDDVYPMEIWENGILEAVHGTFTVHDSDGWHAPMTIDELNSWLEALADALAPDGTDDDAAPVNGEYAALRARAVESGSPEDLAALGEWFQANGHDYWNGECFDADDGLRLFPIYLENNDGDIEITGYEFR